MDNTEGKFCAVCKHKNLADATVCEFCGAVFDIRGTTSLTTERVIVPADFPLPEPRPKTDELVPEGSIAIFLVEHPKPIAVMDKDIFILGRKTEETTEEIVDLSPFGAYDSGVSRRHAMIVRKGRIFEIIDLDSTNGIWLNENRLSPAKPYPLFSGATIRLGQFRLQVIIGEGIKKDTSGEETIYEK